jgi:uncharacterized repeat protein (TIGR01451 family)
MIAAVRSISQSRAVSLAGVVIVWCTLAIGASAARAEVSGPQWTVTSVSSPTNFKPGDVGVDAYRVTVKNTGGSSTDGSPITVTDELPAGLSLGVTGAVGQDSLHETALSCGVRTCTYGGVVVPDDTLVLTFPVDVSETAPASVTNVLRVHGGGASDGEMDTPTAISASPAGFGIAPGGATTALSTLAAGAHPDLTTSIAFNTVDAIGALGGDPKDTTFDLPPGFAGDLVDTPTCSSGLFSIRACPIGSQVGVVTLTLTVGHNPRGTALLPVYNLAASPGELARLAFYALNVFPVEGEVTLRPGDYGLRTTFHNTDESPAELDSVSLTVWGVPAAALHDPLRWEEGQFGLGHFGVTTNVSPSPFLTNPTICSGAPLDSKFAVTSWQQPEHAVEESMPLGALTACDQLTMAPAFSATPTTGRASAPTGLDAELEIPQTYDNAEGRATSTLEKASVTLPQGITVNPSAGAGLDACTQAQYEEEPIQPESLEGCPSTAKLGTVEIVTPALKESVTGSVYVAQPYENQFGSLLAVYVVARIPSRGVLIKVAGKVSADPVTGQITATFEDLPPLPFTTFTFRFRQGATSPLVTPEACGAYRAEAHLTPWATLGEVLEPLIPSFEIDSAFDGGPCPGAGVPPFSPTVTAGTLNNDAGSYSPLDIRIVREDGEQEITGLSFNLPPGLSGNLSGIPFCSEAEIALARTKTGAQEQAEPSCSPASEIGHTLVGAGVGSVLAYAPGKIYMAGPYEGAPFSVVSITSAKVGPFDLGTVVVHLPLHIDPHTVSLTVASGGANQIPHIIDGIVIHVRDIRIYVNRKNFTLNPTSCQKVNISATVTGSGANYANPADANPVSVNDPYQAADCASLKFEPKFTAAASGKNSKANGASLSVKLSYPAGSLGTQSNIKQVKVELPKQLPSRLTTLQKACTAAQFNTNPAGCPAASVIGHAKAITPILPVPLEGPAYFVSNGGEAFPNLIMVLQGYGVTIDLVGSTFISKTGITSSTFKTVPDQPVSSFELTLPQGAYSALAANGSLCAPTRTVSVKKTVTKRVKGKTKRVKETVRTSEPTTLEMPTSFIAQNGAETHQTTTVSITGCAKAHKAIKKKKAKKATQGAERGGAHGKGAHARK